MEERQLGKAAQRPGTDKSGVSVGGLSYKKRLKRNRNIAFMVLAFR